MRMSGIVFVVIILFIFFWLFLLYLEITAIFSAREIC